MADNEALVALMGVLADPTVTKARAKELLDAANNLDRAKADHAKRLKEIEVAQADAGAIYKKAAAAQNDAARDLKLAEEKRKEAQDRKDKADIAVSEGAALNEKNRARTAELDTREKELAVNEKRLTAESEALAKREADVAAMKKDLQAKLTQLKALTA